MTSSMRSYRIAVLLILLMLLLRATGVRIALAQAELLLFGGPSHDTFLGCLTCGKLDPDSVCNRFGAYGSRFSSMSIWNRYGQYGSKYSSESPRNKYASNPPVIVDREGNFYGYFTSNRYYPNRTRIEFFLIFLDNVDAVNEDLEQARDLFCGE